MKAAESEVPDVHFTVDKQNVSLWPRGKHQALLRICLLLCVLLLAGPSTNILFLFWQSLLPRQAHVWF